jgi:hypothetical protein
MVGAAICILGVALAVFMKELPLRRWGPAAQSGEAAPSIAVPAAQKQPDRIEAPGAE